MNTRNRDRLGLLVLLGAPLLLPFAIGRIEPIPGLFDLPAPPAEVRTVQDDESFRIERLARADGTPVHGAGGFAQLQGGRFARNAQEAMHAQGRVQLPAGAHLWAFMQGAEGEVYMQWPEPLVQGDQWVATNLRVGAQVQRIVFAQVDDALRERLLDKGRREDWKPMPTLPAGARSLGQIELAPVRP